MSGHAAITRYPAPSEQPLLRAALRGALTLLFRGLIRPGLPISGQRLVLRVLTAVHPTQPGVRRQAGQLAGRPCEWHRPQGASHGTLLYLHGGAFMLGAPASHRALCAALAHYAQLDVCALDYRLAPEHPFPAALDDALAAYRCLRAQDERALFIGGDSAGGNLALVTCLRLREQAISQPAALLCLAPVVDFSGVQLHQPAAGDPLLNPAWLEQAHACYCPPGVDPLQPWISPINANLHGLPPLLLQVGEDELLRNDSLRLAEKAAASGVRVRLEHYLGLWHVFQCHAGLLHAADRALQSAADFLRQHS